MSTGSLFGGSGNPPQMVNPEGNANVQWFLNLLNAKSVERYLIDPEGSKIEMEFTVNGTVTIKTASSSVTFTYKRL